MAKPAGTGDAAAFLLHSATGKPQHLALLVAGTK